MRTLFEQLAKYALLRAILYVALGVLMLIAPQTVLNIMVYILAGYVIFMGGLSLINYLRSMKSSPAGLELVSGILLVVLGIVILVFKREIISIIHVFMGVLLVIGGATHIAQAVNAGVSEGKINILLLVLGLIVVAGGILVIIKPFASALALFRVFGAVAIAMGIGELVTYFEFREIAK